MSEEAVLDRAQDTPDDQFPIRVRGVRNLFGEHVVHDGLDLDVRKGEILGGRRIGHRQIGADALDHRVADPRRR